MEKALTTRILELCDEPIYLGHSIDELSREIAENYWGISASQPECAEVTVTELEAALNEVIVCRRKQVAAQADQYGATFYCWFDEQACQLRFCLISGRHNELPFGCVITVISFAKPILAKFLASPYHTGIPWDALEEAQYADPGEIQLEHRLDVFTLCLP
ncbi:MAG: hypothetical protein ACYDCO_17760 [Armatimonadota bacterium]